MSWAAFKPWLVMGLIFGAGMIAGASLVVAFRPDLPHMPPGTQQLRSHWLLHLTHELDLTPDQQAKVEPILADADSQIQALHRRDVEGISHIMDTANEKIAPLLTPQQQETLKKIRSERDHTFSHHMGPWEGPHGPGDGKGFPPGGPPPNAPAPGP